MLALLTRTDQERVMQRVEARLVKLEGKEQESAARLFVLISGLRGLEEPVVRRLSMIDLMENKVFRRVIRRGRAEGKAEGKAESLAQVLEARFGSPLPSAILHRVSSASLEELERWLSQALKARRLEDTFR